MTDLRDWLRGNRLEQYADIFEANDIDLDILPDLNEHDLEQLGLSLGNRRRLLKAIAGRGAEAAPSKPIDPDGIESRATPTRRQVTVLFADMVGSTALSGKVDPELLGGLIRRYQDATAGAIGRYGGFVAKFMGDGVLAYFGFPLAFEDAAERAVRAAIAIIAEVGSIELPDTTRGAGADRHCHRSRRGRRNHRQRHRARAHHRRRNAQPRRAAAGACRARHHSRQRSDPEFAGWIVRARATPETTS